MTAETPEELTVKEQYDNCKGFECPRLLALCKTGENGRRYFTEGDMAYNAIAACNNWAIGISDGDCPIEPTETEAKV
jgi:hypothetical protein